MQKQRFSIVSHPVFYLLLKLFKQILPLKNKFEIDPIWLNPKSLGFCQINE